MGDIHAVVVGTGRFGELEKSLASLGSIINRVSRVTHLQESLSALGNPLVNKKVFTGMINEAIALDGHESYYLFLPVGESLDAGFPERLQMDSVYLMDNRSSRVLFVSKELLMEAVQGPYNVPFIEALIPVLCMLINSEQKCETLQSRGKSGSSKENRVKMDLVQKYQKQSGSAGPTLGVIISVFNCEKWIDTAISSCLLQTFPFFEVLVIDDGSIDQTPALLREWERKGVRVFSCSNRGKAKALNRLIPHLKADFVLELDADDWLDPDACLTIRSLLEKIPYETVCLYGNLRCWREKEGKLEFKAEKEGRAVHSRKELLSYQFPLGPRIYRTSTLKEVNGFPMIDFADGRMYEDVSMLVQLQKYGQLQYEKFTVYNVREHPASITRKNRPGWSDFLNALQD